MQAIEKSWGHDVAAKQPNEDFPESLQKIVNNIIKKEGYISYDVKTKNLSTNGGSYLGVLYAVEVKGETDTVERETNIFLKHIIPLTNLQIVSVDDAYVRESYTYRELFKVFNELQDEAKIPEGERFRTIKCYDGTNTEAIVLENLAKKGYRTYGRTDVVSLEFSEQSIQQIAKFHGLSMVLQKRRPEYFEKNIKSVRNPYVYEQNWEKFSINAWKNSAKHLSSDTRKKVEEFFLKSKDKFTKYVEDNSLSGCTLCHGDFKTNNILVNESNGEIADLILIDYQLLFYGCPIYDFFYFMFIGTDQKFRRNHIDNLKNLYFDTLEKYLLHFNVNTDEVYPRKEFENQYRERMDYGLFVAMYFLPFSLVVEGQEPDLGVVDLTKLEFNLDERFDKRVEEIVEDLIHWGYL